MSIIERSMHINSQELAPDIVNSVLELLNTELFEKRTVGELISGYKGDFLGFENSFNYLIYIIRFILRSSTNFCK